MKHLEATFGEMYKDVPAGFDSLVVDPSSGSLALA